jgi:zinc-ribbon domain
MTGAKCKSCSAPIKPGVRFCHNCGAPSGTSAAAASSGSRMPWLVAGIAVVLLIIVAVAKSNVSGPPTPAPVPIGGGGGIATTDLTTMSPREQANRLFNRIMTASERGDSGEVAFFTPMAVQAYELLGTMDSDSRYDLGMIYTVSGETAQALAQADTLEQTYPNHLLAKVIRAAVAQLTGDEATLGTEYREYLDAFDDEIALDRIEYNAHRRTIDSFKEEALAGLR